MGSLYPPGFYDEKCLQAIEATFREVCDELVKASPIYGYHDDIFRSAIVQRLLRLVEQGITDPIELKVATLSYFMDTRTSKTRQTPL